jgi:FtsH-binding integral membrane protein
MENSKTWSWVVLLVTLAYLIVETSFSSELLNIVGQKASTADITSIEHWGRCISGFAVGLILWSFITPSTSIFGWRPFSKISQALFINIVVTLCVMGFVYHWEMGIVDAAKADNSGVKRKEAVYAAFVRSGLLNGTVMLTGMPQGDSVYRSPEGKSFIALLPLLADSESDLSSKVDGVLRAVVENNVRVQVHGSQGFYDGVFLPSAHRMASAWLEYTGMVDRLNAAYRLADNAPTHDQAVIIRNNANAHFHASFRKAFSLPGAPADVNPVEVRNAQEFFALPAIVRLWAHDMHAPVTQPMMPNESYQMVRSEVWPDYLRTTADKELQTFRANTADFRDGGIYARQGRNATILLTVPAMALILSVIGMLIHSTKILYYFQKVFGKEDHHNNAKRLFVALFISGGTACLFYLLSNSITQAALYHHLIAEYQQDGHGMWPAWMLTWIIQAERVVYPVADFLRQHVLLGYHFGVAHVANGPRPECTGFDLFEARIGLSPRCVVGPF